MNYEPDHSDNTNVALLVNPKYALLGEYVVTPELYHCPADRSTVRFEGRSYPRVRSVSMNVFVARVEDCLNNEPRQVGPRTTTQIPNPALQFVFIDEHPDSIGGMVFWVSRSHSAVAKGAGESGPLLFHWKRNRLHGHHRLYEPFRCSITNDSPPFFGGDRRRNGGSSDTNPGQRFGR